MLIFHDFLIGGLQAFIKNFYADNASRLLRTDRCMYTILAYLALYRLDELGFVKFKEFTLALDPDKVYNFASYIFNKVSIAFVLQ